MSGTTRPLMGALVGALLVLGGLYLALGGSGVMAFLGWLFVVIGALSVVGNLWLHRNTRR